MRGLMKQPQLKKICPIQSNKKVVDSCPPVSINKKIYRYSKLLHSFTWLQINSAKI